MRLALLLAAGLSAYGQPHTFEVASIRSAPPPERGVPMRVGCTGGPETKDPGLFTCVNMSAHNLVLMAYDLKIYQLAGIERAGGDQYNLTARVPAGATKDQLREMLQNLLTERFGLKVHREQKEMPAYELVVAKGGPKLKESEPEKEAEVASAPPQPPPFKMGKDGYPELPPGRAGTIMMNGMATRRAVRETMAQFASALSSQVGRPVIDATGLTAKYDFVLNWSFRGGPPAPPPPGGDGSIPAAAEPSGPTIFNAIQEQLGLKLESKKSMVEIVVVDKIEKTPTEN